MISKDAEKDVQIETKTAETHDLKSEVVHAEWYRGLARYEKADNGKATGQLLNTLLPYVALWVLMVAMLRHGMAYWTILPLILVAGVLSVRIFIFFHDCCHNCFFTSAQANRFWGYVCGVLTFTPFDYWRHQHAAHHASSGDLDRRGKGDIWTMTVAEYRAAPRWKQICYRMFRHPFVLFIIGPPAIFLLSQRFPDRRGGKRERDSVAFTNLALLAILGAMIYTIGVSTYLLIQLPVMGVAGILGVWMFYVQHQYEGVYWQRHSQWDPIHAALEGSSYYKLPAWLQWCTGNIGLHHIHHLRPRIPNYNLQRCYDETPPLQNVRPLTFRESLHCLFLNIYDESSHRLVSFRELKAR